MTPIVLVYQSWTFWVFRTRIGADDLPPEPLVRKSDEVTAESVCRTRSGPRAD